MKKTNVFVVVCILFFGLLNAHGSTLVYQQPINIIVVLDTSDRISRPGQVENDIEIVKEIVAQFDKLVRDHLQQDVTNNERIEYAHRLACVVPDQPRVPSVPSNIMRELEIRDSGNENSYPEFESLRDSLLSQIPRVYDFVEQYNQTGSDIWGWFQDEAQDYLIKGYQNRIICLSDGYLIFDADIQARRSEEGTCMCIRGGKIDMSKPLVPIDEGFEDYDVSFLMLEIDVREEGSFENMKEYWETWLGKIGITKTDFAKRGRWLRKLQSFIFSE